MNIEEFEKAYIPAAAEYQRNIAVIGRSAMLKLCRAGGLTAHKNATEELPLIIWLNFGLPKWKRDNGVTP